MVQFGRAMRLMQPPGLWHSGRVKNKAKNSSPTRKVRLMSDDNNRIRLAGDNVHEWYAPIGRTFRYNLYSVVGGPNAGGGLYATAYHHQVSALNVQAAADLVKRSMENEGWLQGEGVWFNAVEAIIETTPDLNEIPAGNVELIAAMPLDATKMKQSAAETAL